MSASCRAQRAPSLYTDGHRKGSKPREGEADPVCTISHEHPPTYTSIEPHSHPSEPHRTIFPNEHIMSKQEGKEK
ncbi:hypothetical protein NEOLEDRAFT_1136836 [Neolentinus lepideus HHB14362 ss-1]|uniref:Uncharacterized protein n=1 Tax=Neolentinus lepideus HHB14362 ss-1 TaxID=1314782 RepID=A0A165QKR6_9AGAM|nr:hypothetical protein NEOLEDRAFT_1137764 [Neolentinus lepideus HHB14362 ss-1]KZT23208.1 hypothetical protein NEOLEDRAFT_1136836 [Neolentinus lepideus HHB14362 ss-1]